MRYCRTAPNGHIPRRHAERVFYLVLFGPLAIAVVRVIGAAPPLLRETNFIESGFEPTPGKSCLICSQPSTSTPRVIF